MRNSWKLDSLLAKGSVELVPRDTAQDGYYSHYFLVPKKDGGFRPILNLNHLSKCAEGVDFRMLHTPILLSFKRKSDWLVSVDL